MAKGQLRGNREAKKPKQPKKPAAPAAFGAAAIRASTTIAGAKKK
ncbi:MAG: hypothetical protein ACYDEV_05020 [Acidiferrobacter sp.]